MNDHKNAFKKGDMSPQLRVRKLLPQMQLQEKIAQLHSAWLVLSETGDHVLREDNFAGSKSGESWHSLLQNGLGQVTRPLGTRSIEPQAGVRALNHLQKYLLEETRLGIPTLSHEECLSGVMAQGATLFPSSLAFAATWNPSLIEQVGRAISQEALSMGCRQGLAPVLDVARDARWGRTEETFGEDPYLVGVMATRYVQGLQGKNRQLLATLKHYAGHSGSEGGRNHAPVPLGWRELNDIYLLPFEMAIKLAKAGSVMPAYHDIDNQPLHSSKHLLTQVLREQWGFDGLIVADYIGITLLQSHHAVANDLSEAGALAFNAGLDVELPANDCALHLTKALDRGLIDMAVIDAAVSRVLLEKFRLGLFENPYVDEAAIELRTAASVQLAKEVAEQAIVVLDNKGVLPLSPSTRIAAIGPTADDPLAMLGDYSFPVHVICQGAAGSATQVVTPLQGLEQVCGEDNVQYAQGCYILEQRNAGNPVFPGDVDDSTTLATTSAVSTRLDLIDAAVKLARDCDVAIVCVGDLSGIFQTGTVGEGSDAQSLALPGVQQTLLQAIVDTGKPTVVVQTSGRPYNLGGLERKLSAQIMAFFGGEQGGTALANVLTGKTEPSGRLALSVPRSAGACPYFYNHKFKSSGTPVALHFGSDYPFGHGMSYTRFSYENLVVESDSVDAGEGTLRLSFTLANCGDREGVEVVQLYVRDKVASLVRPVKELKGFSRVALRVGQAAQVMFEVPVDMLNFTGPQGVRMVEPGEFDIMIGASSADIRLSACVNVTGDVRLLPVDWRMLSNCQIQLQQMP